MPWAAKRRKKKITRKDNPNLPCRQWKYLYNRTAWKKMRLAHLRAYPLCVQCLQDGKSVAATIVDHVEPHKGNVEVFFTLDNLQSLCKMHHDRKTWQEGNSQSK